jgi:hypothetical protein
LRLVARYSPRWCPSRYRLRSAAAARPLTTAQPCFHCRVVDCHSLQAGSADRVPVCHLRRGTAPDARTADQRLRKRLPGVLSVILQLPNPFNVDLQPAWLIQLIMQPASAVSHRQLRHPHAAICNQQWFDPFDACNAPTPVR